MNPTPLTPLTSLVLASMLGCTSAPADDPDAGRSLEDGGSPLLDAAPRDAGADDASEQEMDAGTVASCAAPFRPLFAHDSAGDELGTEFLSWRRSVTDDTHAVSHGRAVRVTMNPGTELLPACSGGHFYAGRTALPTVIPQGKTVWFRIYQYIPSTFSFGYKYSRGAGDADAASACGQSADGNATAKWLVFAPEASFGTARIYLNTAVARRALAAEEPRLRLISEALHRPHDAPVELPRDRWFALQLAVHVSDGDDGYIRGWLDDEFLGEVSGPTTVADASIGSWGMGDYWNGVPWTDGAEGRTDFWVDEIVVASDADGYDPPTGVDADGRPYIAPCTRTADLLE